jgi:hypothetical protein
MGVAQWENTVHLSLIFNLCGVGSVGALTPVDHECSPWLIMLLAKEEDQHKGCGG